MMLSGDRIYGALAIILVGFGALSFLGGMAVRDAMDIERGCAGARDTAKV